MTASSVLSSAGEGALVLSSAGRDSVLSSAGRDSVISSVGRDSGTILQSELGSESDELRYARPKEAILVTRIIKIGYK